MSSTNNTTEDSLTRDFIVPFLNVETTEESNDVRSHKKDKVGMGLIFQEVGRTMMDLYFTEQDTTDTFGCANVYLDSDENGVVDVKQSTTGIDEVDDLFLIFDRIDENNYPFESVTITINDTIILNMTSTCAQMLDIITGHTMRTSQIVFQLPIWCSTEYNRVLKAPKNLLYRENTPIPTTHIVCTVKTDRPYTLGLSVLSIPLKHRLTCKSANYPKEIGIDCWNENHHEFGDKEISSTSHDVSSTILPEDNYKSIVEFPYDYCSYRVLTDVMFGAFGNDNLAVPIKYVRLLNDNHEILTINTSQLQYTSYNKFNKNIYHYSHLPGTINVTKFENLHWQVEFFDEISYADIYIYPRVWNILRVLSPHQTFYPYL